MLTIGEFAQVTHLSVRTLRKYHSSGLLEPAHVDRFSGYRHYELSQIATAQVIHRLRELDLPLAEVKAVISTTDPDERADLIARHLARLQERLDRTTAAVASLQRLLDPKPPTLDVEVRPVEARIVAGIEEVVGHDRVLDFYAGAMAELDAAVPHPNGPPGGLYANELFTEERGRMLVYLPVDQPATPSGRVRAHELPPAELAVTVHHGDHDTIDVTYGELGAWVAEHTLTLAGPVHEVYLVGPRDTPDPDSWRTEIGWPVLRVGAA